MAVLCVSFEIKYDTTYNQRYDTFNTQLKKSGRWWDENTSYVVVQTTETLDEFCSRIYLESDFDESKDRFLVLDSEVKAGRVRGPISDQDIFTLLPFVKKL